MSLTKYFTNTSERVEKNVFSFYYLSEHTARASSSSRPVKEMRGSIKNLCFISGKFRAANQRSRTKSIAKGLI